MDESPDIRLTVTSLCREDLRRAPSGSLELADVGLLQCQDDSAVIGLAQYADGRIDSGGIGVDEVFHVIAVDSLMSALFGSEAGEATAVQPDLIIVNEVGILVGIHAVGGEVDHAGLFVHLLYATYVELAFGDLAYHLRRLPVIEVEMAVSVALTGPKDMTTVGEVVAVVL